MPLYTSQIEAQRFLLRLVPKGYRWWVSGTVENRQKLDQLKAKFDEHYGTSLSPAERTYKKSCGLAQAHFVVAPLPIEVMDGGWIWFLIATDGKGPIRQNGKLKDATTNAGRISWGDYVLYEASRHRKEGGGTRWSWYIKPEVQKRLDHYVGELLKTAPHELRDFIAAQCRRPMHHGIRHYLTRMIRRAHQNFTRMYPEKPWTARDPSTPLPIVGSYKTRDVV